MLPWIFQAVHLLILQNEAKVSQFMEVAEYVEVMKCLKEEILGKSEVGVFTNRLVSVGSQQLGIPHTFWSSEDQRFVNGICQD